MADRHLRRDFAQFHLVTSPPKTLASSTRKRSASIPIKPTHYEEKKDEPSPPARESPLKRTERRGTTSASASGALPSRVREVHAEDKAGRAVELKHTSLKAIAKGSFGQVFLSTLPEEGGKQVAIKRIKEDRNYKSRELELMKSLSHPLIVDLLYFYAAQDGDNVYLHLVMEYLPSSLVDVITKRGPLPADDCRIYAFQLLRGIGYLRSLGVCHRDLKPANILVDHERKVLKVCDFGSAKKLIPGESSIAYICSRFYRAPELIFGCVTYTPAIDVWSVGCIFVEMFLGEPLFQGSSAADLLVKIVKVLGSPTQDEITEMSRSGLSYTFPIVRRRPWPDIVSGMPPAAAELATQLLRYTPEERVTPYEALLHPFFEPLLSAPDVDHLFAFTVEEETENSHVVSTLLDRRRV